MSGLALETLPPPTLMPPSLVEVNTELPPSESLARLQLGRREFVNALVEQNLISPAFAESGDINEFGFELPEQGHVEEDSLIHTLVGDKEGFHHLPTALALGLDRSAASQLHSPERPHKSMGDLRKEQRIKPDGTYRPHIVAIEGIGKATSKTNAMFPNDWNTEQVIRAIVQVAHTPPVEAKPGNRTNLHEGEVNGIRIRVLTDDETHKIVTGYPK
ncbi:hypothetical protein A3F65_04205 [Candidatus Saccharibacteria bacterium RIFCSPHIGHO2_12_FULL_47_16b]|nr:MAG: hypothetical protein A3F65_04205 [Candidatus Saccharibacteria bacterium RIFCSPHIGHO2_12_FULL_47_16b]